MRIVPNSFPVTQSYDSMVFHLQHVKKGDPKTYPNWGPNWGTQGYPPTRKKTTEWHWKKEFISIILIFHLTVQYTNILYAPQSNTTFVCKRVLVPRLRLPFRCFLPRRANPEALHLNQTSSGSDSESPEFGLFRLFAKS